MLPTLGIRLFPGHHSAGVKSLLGMALAGMSGKNKTKQKNPTPISSILLWAISEYLETSFLGWKVKCLLLSWNFGCGSYLVLLVQAIKLDSDSMSACTLVLRHLAGWGSVCYIQGLTQLPPGDCSHPLQPSWADRAKAGAVLVVHSARNEEQLWLNSSHVQNVACKADSWRARLLPAVNCYRISSARGSFILLLMIHNIHQYISNIHQ